MAISGIPTTIGNDTVTVTPTGAYSVDGLAGTDTLILNFAALGGDISYDYIGSGYYRYSDGVRTQVDFLNFERFDITGGAGDDRLVGGSLNDRLVGGLGNDRFEGGLGADTILGGGGAGDRWVADYSGLATPISLTLTALGTSTVIGSNLQLNGVEAISLTTGAGTDTVLTEALRADDSVSTGAGDDLIALGRGTDSADGGDDVDTLRMDWSAVTDPNAAITNGYVGSGWYRYGNGFDRTDYLGFERYHLIGGAGGDQLYGAALNDTLTGNAGNDTLAGGAGSDKVEGGDGIDLWQLDTSGRLGTTVLDLRTQTDNFGATLTGIERLSFTGGNGIDRVTALAGRFNDAITTGDGNDVVTSGRGSDSVDLGVGIGDRLVMDWSGINDARHGITLTYIGSDWFRYRAVSGDLLDYRYVENFDLSGGAGDDYLAGGTGNDTLNGNGGDDTLNGAAGDGSIDGGAGNDLWTADLSPQSAAIFDAATSQATAQLTGLGLSVLGIERLNLTTGNGSDNISTAGYALDDTIVSSGGQDTLNAGLGFDHLEAGDGTDLMVIDYASATSAVSTRYIGSGFFRTEMADGTAFTDWIGVDRYALTGGLGNDALGGGALSDTLTGNSGNDTLNGFRGADSILGGDGNDTWVGDYGNLAVGVTLNLSVGGTSSVVGTGTRLNGVENISLITGGGADLINLSAASGSDTINAGTGDDSVNLGRGVYESSQGGEGNDTLTIDAALATGTTRMTYIGGGYDRIQAADGSYTADFAGYEHFNFAGSARGDRVHGFDFSDSLNGKAGTDFLNGARGDDILTGGTGADVFEFSDLWNAGHDTITDAATGDLLRFYSFGLTGSVIAGNGAGALAGEVQVSSSAGTSTLYIGLDGTAGADLVISLTGSFAAANFAASGGDLILV